jgi:hypothetical protein
MTTTTLASTVALQRVAVMACYARTSRKMVRVSKLAMMATETI